MDFSSCPRTGLVDLTLRRGVQGNGRLGADAVEVRYSFSSNASYEENHGDGFSLETCK